MRTWLGVMFLLGCGGPAAGEGTLELGTGEVGFETLEDYQPVALVAGPQGGHHIWLSLRAEGLSSDRVLLEVDAVPLEETEPPPRREPVRIFMTPVEGDMREIVGWPAQLAEPECLVDVPLSVRVTLTDSRGNQISDERIVVPQDDPLLGECL
ncbi:MAG: hypothetical protein AAGE52_22200 [Myxococcota bacterium]